MEAEFGAGLKICRWQHRAGSIPASGTSIHAAYSEVSAVQASSPFRRRSASTAMHVPQTEFRMPKKLAAIGIVAALLATLGYLAWPFFKQAWPFFLLLVALALVWAWMTEKESTGPKDGDYGDRT